MQIYLYILAAVLIFGAIMPQKGPNRKYYIILMTVIHTFVCAFRYEHLTGDLLKYHWEFLTMSHYGWLDEGVLHEGRNAGFYMLMKLVNDVTGADFQVLLIVIAVVTHIILAYVVYRYSPAPWMSYLVWNCMALYIFGFSAIKQALAMAFVMLSFVGIAEKRPWFFLGMMMIAGSVHMPALVFLPAYWLAQRPVNGKMLLLYLCLGAMMYVFKNQFVAFIKTFYYEDDEVMVFSGEIGNRFVMLLGFTLFGILFTGFDNKNFEKLFHLMAVAAILQLLAGFDNIFTRLTDYYFQFSVLYIPMTFYPAERDGRKSLRPLVPFDRRSLKVLSGFIVVFLLWFYYKYNIGYTVDPSETHVLNFRFMWDVQ